MKYFIKQNTFKILLIIPAFLVAFSLTAQDKSSYEEAKSEIKATFGIMPSMFEVFPDYALAGAWETFKQLSGPESKIPRKYQELIQLGVAAQIPCHYCVYFHTASAEAFGATEEEIQEAIALGAQTRHWSMILQGNEIEFEAFKKEFDRMMDYMAEKQKE